MIRKVQSHIRAQWAGFLALVLVLTGGIAVAAFDPIGPDGDIDACFEQRTGDLDLQTGKRCGKGERRISWTQSPENAATLLSKLAQVDGAGSGLDADAVDSLGSEAFVLDADSAGGDLSGPFSSLQLGIGAVGGAELEDLSVDAADIAPSLGNDSSVPILLSVRIFDGADVTDAAGRDLQVIDAWSIATSTDGGTWTLQRSAGSSIGPGLPITNTVTVAAAANDVDRATDVNPLTGGLFVLAGNDGYTVDATGSLDAQVFVLAMPQID